MENGLSGKDVKKIVEAMLEDRLIEVKEDILSKNTHTVNARLRLSTEELKINFD